MCFQTIHLHFRLNSQLYFFYDLFKRTLCDMPKKIIQKYHNPEALFLQRRQISKNLCVRQTLPVKISLGIKTNAQTVNKNITSDHIIRNVFEIMIINKKNK